MDEKNQVLTINVWLDQEWGDELLRWDPKRFGGIDSIRIPCDLIWLPDIVLYNNADDYTTGYMRSRAMVYYDGTVFWPPPTQLRSTCKIDVTYFPFDSQRCYLKFGSWTYHGFQVDVTNRSDNVDLTNYVVSGEFDLVSVHQKRRVVKYTCYPEPYPDVTFFIHIRRKTLYYMYNVVFPCMMMSALTLLVFCLPPDSGEKIALGITVLLAFSVFVLAIAEKMPETSDSMPLIGIYLTVVMGMTSVSVVMTVMVLNFHHRGPFHKEIPYWIRWLVLDKLRRALCMKLPYSDMRQPKHSSLLRRLSLKLTIDNLQDELMQDMGLDSRHRSSSYNATSCDPFVNEQALVPNCVGSGSGDAIPLQRLGGGGTGGGGGGRGPSHPLGAMGKSQLHEEVLKTLQVLISRQELDDECEEIANEWRQVAQVIDRLLFWIFLFATVLLTLALLIIIPLVRHAQETDKLDEALFGLSS